MSAQANVRPIIIKKKKVIKGGGHHGGAWKVAIEACSFRIGALHRSDVHTDVGQECHSDLYSSL